MPLKKEYIRDGQRRIIVTIPGSRISPRSSPSFRISTSTHVSIILDVFVMSLSPVSAWRFQGLTSCNAHLVRIVPALRGF